MSSLERCPYTVGKRICISGLKGHAGPHIWPSKRVNARWCKGYGCMVVLYDARGDGEFCPNHTYREGY